MLVLVEIDLVHADLALFDAYEEQVLKLLAAHSGRLEMRVRSVDQSCETHLLFFESKASFDAFLVDPVRGALQKQWLACNASSTVSEVVAIGA